MELPIYSGLFQSIRSRKISGIVYELGLPVSRTVRAYSRASGAILSSTKSGADGRYEMIVPEDNDYMIVSLDPSRKFNAVIQDMVKPK